MKKTGKILFSMAAVGAVISAAAFAVKKYNDRCGKPVPDMEPDDGFWEEYFPGQEESVPSGSDGPGSADVDGEENTAVRGIYLTANEAGFLRYILEGIENIGIITDSRIAGVEKLTRKRKISNAARIRPAPVRTHHSRFRFQSFHFPGSSREADFQTDNFHSPSSFRFHRSFRF